MDEKEQLVYYKQTGDLQVLGKLYAPYMSLLYGVCFKYFQEQTASQDAVMQIFEQLVDKLRIHQVENFKSWLYVFARNYCLMELRKGKGKQFVNIEENMLESERKRYEEDMGKWEEKDFENVHTCIESLSKKQAVCIRLFYLEQKCYKDIAEETGYELNKVKSYIQNGKRNLKICMERGRNGQ